MPLSVKVSMLRWEILNKKSKGIGRLHPLKFSQPLISGRDGMKCNGGADSISDDFSICQVLWPGILSYLEFGLEIFVEWIFKSTFHDMEPRLLEWIDIRHS